VLWPLEIQGGARAGYQGHVWLRSLLLITVAALVTVVGGAQIGGKGEAERIPESLEAGERGSEWGGESAYAASAPGDVPFVVVEAVSEPPASDAPEPPPEADSVAETPVETAICAFDWHCPTALRIVRCESNFRPDAVGVGSYGLFQIQASVHSWKWPDFWEAWSDPVRNAEYAWEVYVSRGYSWDAWSCA